ncbi:hypothetical protein [Hamadaea tsunoensis]|uniref:hypothetical protein n=1 Tax=Hamadaea tsunoensis TaxID=53368 RepID=UPI0003F90B40|nr:hypothetical protein [Hamadaea tsunoensis]
MTALSLLDLAAYRAQRALDSVVLAQITWISAADPDPLRLRQTAARLAATRQLGRVVVPARVPGGRDHWGPLAAVPEVVVEDSPLDRAALLDWAEARAGVPIDAGHRPWHLAARPLTGGGHVATLVVSHALTDGIGLLNALAAEPPARQVPRHLPHRGVLPGLREALSGLPSGVRAALLAARRSGSPVAAPRCTRTRARAALATVDASAWRAASGGSSNALFLSIAGRVAVALGRVAADGRVLLGMPVNDRAAGDDVTANALTTVTVELPADRVDDLAYIRREVKKVLTTRSEPVTALLPIVPYLPRRALRPVALAALGGAGPVTSASHVGRLPAAVAGADLVFLNLGMQHPEGVAVPERVNAVCAESPQGTVALHVAAAIENPAPVRDALHAAVTSAGLAVRELW